LFRRLTAGRHEEILLHRFPTKHSTLYCFILTLQNTFPSLYKKADTDALLRNCLFVIGELLRMGLDPTEGFYEGQVGKAFSSSDALILFI